MSTAPGPATHADTAGSMAAVTAAAASTAAPVGGAPSLPSTVPAMSAADGEANAAVNRAATAAANGAAKAANQPPRRGAPPRHPGRPVPPRRIVQPAPLLRRVDASPAPGDELFAFVRRLAADWAGAAALVDLRGVWLRSAAVHVPENDPTGRQIMRYGEAHRFKAVELVRAQMSVGSDADGAPLLHAHGWLRRADGSLFGGHLAPGGCVVGHGPAGTASASLYPGLRLETVADAETGFDLLSPVALAAGDGPPAGWLLRLKPEEDLADALSAALSTAGCGWQAVGAVGSLMQATLAGADGRVRRVEGPGIEILALESVARADDATAGAGAATANLRLTVADLAGGVHTGRPVAGGNPICVTVELFVAAR